MLINEILDKVLAAVEWINAPLRIVVLIVLTVLVKLSLGVLFYLLLLGWFLFLAPLVGLAWLWEHVTLLRLPVAIVGVPVVVIADVYALWMPSNPHASERREMENLTERYFICHTWPLTFDYWRLVQSEREPESPRGPTIEKIVARVMARQAMQQRPPNPFR